MIAPDRYWEWAIGRDHTDDCDSNYCDIRAAQRAGYPMIAAYFLQSATEAPRVDWVCRRYHVRLLPMDDANWEPWTAWFRANTIECPSCESFVFTDDGWPYSCGNCGTNLPTER